MGIPRSREAWAKDAADRKDETEDLRRVARTRGRPVGSAPGTAPLGPASGLARRWLSLGVRQHLQPKQQNL
eukprot:13842795-Alexandrium_andersonii.AAC.1